MTPLPYMILNVDICFLILPTDESMKSLLYDISEIFVRLLEMMAPAFVIFLAIWYRSVTSLIIGVEHKGVSEELGDNTAGKDHQLFVTLHLICMVRLLLVSNAFPPENV